jgi:hypothetical protein
MSVKSGKTVKNKNGGTTDLYHKVKCDLCNGNTIIETEDEIRKAFNYPGKGQIAKTMKVLVKDLKPVKRKSSKVPTNTGSGTKNPAKPYWNNSFLFEKVDNRLKFLMSYELFEKQMGGLGKNNLSRFTIIPKETKLRLAEIDKSLSSANLSDKERKALEQEKNSLESSLDTNLAQSFEKIKGAMKVLKDEKEKGIAINEEFIQKILDRTEVKGKNLEIQEKHDATANRKVIMSLYAEIYEFLYGKYAKTINVDPLYKEGLQYLQDEGNRSTVAEKIARFAKRSLQFKGEGFYGGLAEFGADLKDFNESMDEIMEYYKK